MRPSLFFLHKQEEMQWEGSVWADEVALSHGSLLSLTPAQKELTPKYT